MNPQLKIEGLDVVQANLSRVSRGFAREQKSIHDHLGQSILDRARGRARIRTGRMASSIRLRSTQTQVEVFTDVLYARYQHYGTRYVSPNPFLTEPLYELEDVLVRDYQRMTERFINRNWRSS